jgi:hypothetical protein
MSRPVGKGEKDPSPESMSEVAGRATGIIDVRLVGRRHLKPKTLDSDDRAYRWCFP